MKNKNQKRKGEKHKLNNLHDGEYGKIVSYKHIENQNQQKQLSPNFLNYN